MDRIFTPFGCQSLWPPRRMITIPKGPVPSAIGCSSVRDYGFEDLIIYHERKNTALPLWITSLKVLPMRIQVWAPSISGNSCEKGPGSQECLTIQGVHSYGDRLKCPTVRGFHIYAEQLLRRTVMWAMGTSFAVSMGKSKQPTDILRRGPFHELDKSTQIKFLLLKRRQEVDGRVDFPWAPRGHDRSSRMTMPLRFTACKYSLGLLRLCFRRIFSVAVVS